MGEGAAGEVVHSLPGTPPGKSTRFSAIPARYRVPRGVSERSFRFAPVLGALVSALARSPESCSRLRVL